MLTIGQLAAYAGVTVRAVRHYHSTGLLPEPERDHSGYRRYGAASVVDLIRIRTLAEAGVPLSRVQAMLDADPEAFADAVRNVDRQLRVEIEERQAHRGRIARLVAGESLALPPEVVAYVDRVRELGFSERLVEVERDSWILISAQIPEAVPALMAFKGTLLEQAWMRDFYETLGVLADCTPDDPRLSGVADRLVVFFERAERDLSAEAAEVPDVSDALVVLLDEAFVESVPAAPRLLELLEVRGWVGWTDVRRTTD